jgi:tyrosine aminotransferase
VCFHRWHSNCQSSAHKALICLSCSSIYHSLREVEAGAKRLAQIILGTSHLPQTAVPALLSQSDERLSNWKLDLRDKLEEQAMFVYSELGAIPGLHVLQPGGAMYTLLRLDTSRFDEAIRSDVSFCEALLREENVFVLPGSCFGLEDMIRIVFCAPIPVLQQATDRIRDFCFRHSLPVHE